MIKPLLSILWTSLLLATVSLSARSVELLQTSTIDPSAITFAKGEKARWAQFVNGRSFQHFPLRTFRGYQYATYFNSDRQLCIARRALPTGSWEVIRFEDHIFEGNNSHDCTVLGICENDGTIHLAFDHHREDLNYRVSLPGVALDPASHAWEASLFGPVTDTLGVLGKQEQVTYPRFISMPNGNLMFYRRYYTSGNGDGVIRVYNGETGEWQNTHGTFIARDVGIYQVEDRISQFRYAYLNAVQYAGSRLHVSWVWRDRFERTDVHNQHDLLYIYSDDDGLTWHNSDGRIIGITGETPVHLDSPGLIVHPIPTNTGLANQNTHYAFEDESVHVILPRHAEGRSEEGRIFHHHWRDSAGVWHSAVMPLTGARPEVIGDGGQNLYLVYSMGKGFRVAKGTPNAERTAWAWSEAYTHQDPNEGGECQIDYSRWESERILSVYYQEGPAEILEYTGDTPIEGMPSALKVFDFRVTP